MTAKNDVTGNPIISKPSSILYREGWDRIFNEKKNADPLFSQEFGAIVVEQMIDAIKNIKTGEESE